MSLRSKATASPWSPEGCNSTPRQQRAVVPGAPGHVGRSASALLRCDLVHVGPDTLDLRAPTVNTRDVGRRRFRHGSDDLESLLTIAARELIDRHGHPP